MLRSVVPTSTASRPARAAVACKASAEPSSRRGLLLGLVAAPVASALFTSPARALLPEEEDEEMVNRAKANRKARLEQERITTRKFMADEGLNNKKLDAALEPVQKGVYELAKTGSQVQSGDIRGAASTLSQPWVAAFASSAAKFGSPDAVVASIGDLKAAASKGDSKASKTAYVAVVDSLQAWATAASLTDKLKGL